MANTRPLLPSTLDQISSPIKLSELNHILSQFKEEMLSYLSQAEAKMNSKITNAIIQYHTSKSDLESSLTSFRAKYDDISQSVASVNVKFDQLTQYETFAEKAKDKLTSHEIRIENLSKEINKIYYKYDRIFIDNLLLPGLIGDCCKYRTTKDFFDDVINQLSIINTYKEKNIADLKAYKDRLESMMKSFGMQVDSINKNAARYTNDAVKESEVRLHDALRDINERLLGLNLENSKYALNMRNLAKSMTEEIKSVSGIKEAITGRIETEISESRKSNTLIQSLFYDFKAEFKSIKKKFEELAGFIRDVRFRKNLGVPIDKKEISTLLRNISFQKGNKTFEEGNNSEEQQQQQQLLNNRNKKKLLRLKPINEGEIDDGNIGEVSNNELHSDCPNKDSAALNRLRQMNLNLETPKGRHSITENQLSGGNLSNNNNNNNNNDHNNQQGQSKVIIVSPEHYTSRINIFDLKKEQKMTGKKINIIEKQMLEFEIYTRDKLNELFRAFTHFISITGINKAGLSLYGNLNVNVNSNTSRSNSRNTNHNHKKHDFNKDNDRYVHVSNNNKVAVSVVDLVKRNPFPVISNLNQPIVNSVTKLNQRKVMSVRGKSSKEQAERFIMRTLGSNQEDNGSIIKDRDKDKDKDKDNSNINNSNNIRDIKDSRDNKDSNAVAGLSKGFMRRGSIGTISNNNSAFTPHIETKIAKKVEKRYPLDHSQINSYKWIPLKETVRKNPNHE